MNQCTVNTFQVVNQYTQHHTHHYVVHSEKKLRISLSSCELKKCPLQRRSADFSSQIKVWRKWSAKQYIRRHSCKVSTTSQQLIYSPSLKSLQQLHTTGTMEAKLLAVLSLLLAVGQFTGEQNQSRNQKHSFFPVPSQWCIFWREEVMFLSSMSCCQSIVMNVHHQ